MNQLNIQTELEYDLIDIENSKYTILNILVKKDPFFLFHEPHKYYIVEKTKANLYLQSPNILQKSHIPPIKPLYTSNEIVLVGSDIFLTSLQNGDITLEDFILNCEKNLTPSYWQNSPYNIENQLKYHQIFPIHLHKDTFSDVNPSYIMDENNNMLFFDISFPPSHVYNLSEQNNNLFKTNYDSNNLWHLFSKDNQLYNYAYKSVSDLFSLYKYKHNHEHRFLLMKALAIKCLKLEEPFSFYLSRIKSIPLIKEIDKLALNYNLENNIENKKHLSPRIKKV